MRTLVGADEPEQPPFLSDNLRAYPITRIGVITGAYGQPVWSNWWSNNAAAAPSTMTWSWPNNAGAMPAGTYTFSGRYLMGGRLMDGD